MNVLKPNKKITPVFNDDDSIIIKDLREDDILLDSSDYILTSNNYLFWFDEGNIDEWCVYCVKPNNRTWFAYDSEYFTFIKRMSKRYGSEKVYDDFVYLYDTVGFDYDFDTGKSVCEEISGHYGGCSEHFWCWLWMTMVAEERKENAILGKRIKRLGIYNLLFDGYKMRHVIQYMRGMKWTELDELMIERGF